MVLKLVSEQMYKIERLPFVGREIIGVKLYLQRNGLGLGNKLEVKGVRRNSKWNKYLSKMLRLYR